MSPYIDKKRREVFKSIENTIPASAVKGELTYCAYHLALQYISQKGKSYQNVSDSIAALNDAAAEIRRRILDPYENKKIKENGDIRIKDGLIYRVKEFFGR